jgi:hypothetical protein
MGYIQLISMRCLRVRSKSRLKEKRNREYWMKKGKRKKTRSKELNRKELRKKMKKRIN